MYRLAPGWLLVFKPRRHREPLHAHDHEQRIRLLRGRLEIRMGARRGLLAAPLDVLVLPARRPHRTTALRDTWLVVEQVRPLRPRAVPSGHGMRRAARRGLWLREVKTESTYPPKGIFTKDAATIARAMASKKVSPKGIGSAIRMIQYFINRGGRGLSKTRRRELERAKEILQRRRKGVLTTTAPRGPGRVRNRPA